MTFDEAIEETVTQAMAKAEIAKHDVEGGFEQFLKDVGDKPVYSGMEVLSWLGY